MSRSSRTDKLLRDLDTRAALEAESALPSGPPPADLCAEHARIWREWQSYPRDYDPSNPREAGGGHIMDDRTSHARRRADWFILARRQMEGTEAACRSGRSPQCSPPEVSVGDYIAWTVAGGDTAVAYVEMTPGRTGGSWHLLASDGFSDGRDRLPRGWRKATEEEAARFEEIRAGRYAPPAYE